MNVISAEANQVHKQEYEGKAQVHIPLLGKIEAKSEKYGDGYPTQIEKSSPEVHHRPIVLGEIFVWCNDASGCSDTK